MQKRKRAGTIALAAVPNLNRAASTLDPDEAAVFSRNVNRWLDNGHNLDAADIDWLAQESRDAVAGMRAARELSEPELPVITVTQDEDGLWQSFHSDDTGDGALWRFPTLEHAVSSARSFLLREFPPRSLPSR